MTHALPQPLWITVRNPATTRDETMGLTIMLTSGGSRRKLSWDNPDPFLDGRAIYQDVLANPGGYTTGFVTIKTLERAELWWSGRPGSTVLFINPNTRQTHWQTVNPNGGDAGVIFYERGLWLYQYRSPLGNVPATQVITHNLRVRGTVDNWRGEFTGIPPDMYGPPHVFGTGIWNDANDSTYAGPFGWSHPLHQTVYGRMDTYTGGRIDKLTLNFRASASGETLRGYVPLTAHLSRGTRPQTGFLTHFFGGSTHSAWSENHSVPLAYEIPSDGVARNYSTVLDAAALDYSGWDALDELRDDLKTKECGPYFDSDGFDGPNPNDPVGTLRIYEAWVTIESPT